MSLKTLRKNLKTMLNSIKYGDKNRPPLVYLETYTSFSPKLYQFPSNAYNDSLKDTQTFPKLSQEILVALFKNIGVKYVPEIALYQLEKKTALKSFNDFCFTFGLEGEFIDSNKLNQVIQRLKKMDRLRLISAWDSRPIYSALAYYNLEKADSLIDEMQALLNMKGKIK